jgi:hypothetical protein
MQMWKLIIGDFEMLREDKGAQDISTEISNALKSIETLELTLSAQLNDVAQQMDLWEDNNVRNLTHLSDKIKALATGAVTSAASPPAPQLSLSLTIPIVDANGVQVTDLGSILHKIGILRVDNVKLMKRIDGIRADLTAQGGVVFGRHTFTSELQVLQLTMAECPGGEAFALFVDPILIFCHDSAYSPNASWQKDTKAMEESEVMSIMDRKVVASYNTGHTIWFTEGKQVVAGKVINAFATAEKWMGTGGVDGQRVEIKDSAETAGDCIRTGIEDKLSQGGKLAQLATCMLEQTLNWYQTVHKHLDSELSKLTQLGVKAKEVLTLLSEEVIIMFDRFYAIRCKCMDFTVKGTGVEYMTRCIWLTLQVHVLMNKFVKDGMKYNPVISAAYLTFLAKQTGSNVGSGVGGKFLKLEDQVKSVEVAAKDAIKVAKEAAQRAATVGTNADSVKTSLKQLADKVNLAKK